MAVLDFINDMNKAIDNNLYDAGIFMDLSKAFDTIDHKILWDKSYHYGFRGVLHAWFTNIFQIENKWFHIKSTLSSRCGMPPGSIF